MASLIFRVPSGLARWFAGMCVAVLVSGCGGSGPDSAGPARTGSAGAAREAFSDQLRKGDLVTVSFSGNPTPPTEINERIKEDGKINLQYVGPVPADGKSPGELQKEIQDLYVPKYYQRLTVTVKTENRVFYVDGEVRSPGRLMYAGELTVMRAIASAGGFTDFAARRRVELIRANGEKIRVDAKRAKDNPKSDPPVIPGDTIFVPRRSPWGG